MKMHSSLLCLLSAGSLAYAQPTNPDVIEGNVSFNTSGSTYTITSTDDRSIVEWGDFSNGSSETTAFALPYSTSALLNRVTGENISSILGEISSNGQVFLINPNGISISSTGVVSAAHFVASSLDVSNEDFMGASDMTFTGTTDDVTVTNEGSLESTAGDIVLLGFRIEDSGTSTAEGNVAFGAGVEIGYHPYDDARISITTSAPQTGYGTGVDSMGTIIAMIAELKADGNLYQQAINSDGSITVTDGNDGLVQIISEDGAIEVSGDIVANIDGSYGGFVEIYGEDIELSGLIDLSSNFGNATAYVGSQVNGSGAPFNAENVSTITGFELDVNATQSGDGGTVVLWAEDTVEFDGDINASSGPYAGDGGFVQICGGVHGYYNGDVDVTGTGNNGTYTHCP